MGKEYLKADEKDYEELVDFINYIRIRIKLSTII